MFERAASKRLIVLGDFNQQVGQSGYAPMGIRDALRDAILPGITIATTASLRLISRFHGERKLSDHPGVVADLASRV